ncbi:MAG: ACT domain-containing protein [Cytophagales bacterium]|nr:ACT domain-containing protein [Armatimonadota bacterium]
MKLSVLPGRFAVCRLAPEAPLPMPPTDATFWSLTQTRDELSLVCAEAEIPLGCLVVEHDWCAFVVAGPLDFALVGVLASLTTTLAQAQISLFAVSTYGTDYLFVKEAALTQAVAALQGAGHTIETEMESP